MRYRRQYSIPNPSSIARLEMILISRAINDHYLSGVEINYALRNVDVEPWRGTKNRSLNRTIGN